MQTLRYVIFLGTAALAVAVWGYLRNGPEFVFLSPQIVSISPSHEAIVPYSRADGLLEVKAQVHANAYTTSDYNVTAFVIDHNGVSTQAPHSAITTTSGTNGDIVSAIVVHPYWAQLKTFATDPLYTLKVTWSGSYKFGSRLFGGSFEKTALIKFPYIWLTKQGDLKQGSGSITVHLSVPLDFPVKILLTPHNLSLSPTSLTIPPNATSGTVTANPLPPSCPPGSVFVDCSTPELCCAYGGFLRVFALDDPVAPTFSLSEHACYSIACVP